METNCHRHVFQPLRRCGSMAMLVGLGCIGLFAGCSDEAPRLYCGAGIRQPIAELAREFEREHHVTLECDYAASELLFSRVQLTGQGDLYMPGDVHYVAMADEEGLIASQKTVCYFIPVIVVPKGNPKKIESLADLLRPELRIALGNPETCAIGRKARKILVKNKIDVAKMNVVTETTEVGLLSQYVALGQIDAAITWNASAAQYAAKNDVVTIPLADNIISTVAIGTLRCSQHPKLAADFVALITSERGREIFKKHHFTLKLPEETTSQPSDGVDE